MKSAIALTLLLIAAVPLRAQEAKPAPSGLDGIWKLVEVIYPDAEPEVPPKLPYWVIKGSTVSYAGKPFAKLAVEAGTLPKTVDLTVSATKHVFEACYEVSDKQLKLCVNTQFDGVKDRPLDFMVKGKAERRLFVFERQEPTAGAGVAEAPGFIGVQIAKAEGGVRVTGVLDKSPAKQAGLQVDDLIIMVGGTAVTDLRGCVDRLRQSRPGSDLTIRVRRSNAERDLTVRPELLPFTYLQ